LGVSFDGGRGHMRKRSASGVESGIIMVAKVGTRLIIRNA
jgi:hypothetical protein